MNNPLGEYTIIELKEDLIELKKKLFKRTSSKTADASFSKLIQKFIS